MCLQFETFFSDFYFVFDSSAQKTEFFFKVFFLEWNIKCVKTDVISLKFKK